MAVSKRLAVVFFILFAFGFSAIAEADTGPVTQVGFATSPSSGTSGVPFPVQPVIFLLDAGNDFVSTATNTVTLTAYSSPTCTQLATGTFSATPVVAVGGVASFSDVTFTGPVSETIWIGASSPGLTSACSSAITLVGENPTMLLFEQSLSMSVTSGQVFPVQPVVGIFDPLKNIISATNVVTLNVYQDLGCTVPIAPGTYTFNADPVSAVNGTATFAGVSYVGGPGKIYLGASSGSLLQDCAGPIQITLPASSASQIAFTIEPSATGNSGVVLPVQPVIEVQNASGEIVNSTPYVGLTAYTNSTCTTPSSGSLSSNALSGAVLTASAGLASFQTVKYTGPDGIIYIGAFVPGLPPICSSAITIGAGFASTVAFTTEPSATGIPGVALGTQPVVQIEDADGNVASTVINSVKLAAYTNSTCTSAASGMLSATTNPLPASSGIASFTNVTYIGPTGTIYLGASVGGITSACSSAINISVGPASLLAFSVEPSFQGLAGESIFQEPVVQIQDAGGNLITTASASVTLSAYTDAGCSVAAGGTLSVATNPLVTSSGVASFQGVEYSTLGTIYIGAFASGFAPACSTAVNFGGGIKAIAAGSTANHTCAVSSAGNVYCWGLNGNGQIGNDTTTTATTSVEVFNANNGVLAGSSLTSGNLSSIAGLAEGSAHTCAVTSSGGYVYCWGSNGSYQLGVVAGFTQNSPWTVPVGASGVNGGYLAGIISLAAGNAHTCALSFAGNVYCWGANTYGQIGNNSTSSFATAVEVLGVGGSGNLSGIVAITAGTSHTCSLSSAGNVYCWGANTNGQIGNNSIIEENAPVEVLGVGGIGNLSGIVAIAAGTSHTCALSSAGNVYCWGANTNGQIGNNTSGNQLRTPVEVLGVGASGNLSGIVGLTAGSVHTCAVSSSGNVYCWGNNGNGQLGNNSTTEVNAPIEVLGVGGSGNLSGIGAITAGVSHTCALSSSGGGIYCWGYNGSGQLGNNSTTDVHTPVPVEGAGL